MTARELSSILAVPVETVRPLMTAGRVETLLGELGEAGLSGLSVQLDGWQKGSDYQKVPVFGKADGAVGGRRAFAGCWRPGSGPAPRFTRRRTSSTYTRRATARGKAPTPCAIFPAGCMSRARICAALIRKIPLSRPGTCWAPRPSSGCSPPSPGRRPAKRSASPTGPSGAILPSDGRRSQFTGARPTDRQTALERYESAYRGGGGQGAAPLVQRPQRVRVPLRGGADRPRKFHQRVCRLLPGGALRAYGAPRPGELRRRGLEPERRLPPHPAQGPRNMGKRPISA